MDCKRCCHGVKDLNEPMDPLKGSVDLIEMIHHDRHFRAKSSKPMRFRLRLWTCIAIIAFLLTCSFPSELVHGWSGPKQSVKTNLSDFYSVLGLPPNAPMSEIKQAYYEKQKLCHPDVIGEDGNEMCMVLNDGYELLKDEESKAEYDKSLALLDSKSDLPAMDPDDPSPSWKWKFPSKEMRGLEEPKFRGTPRSRSYHHKVKEEDRGDMWRSEQFLYVDAFSCISCRYCMDVAPKTFALDMLSGKARANIQWAESEAYYEYALKACPVDCIYWVDRAELQVLEHVTAKRLFETGGETPCPMTGIGERVDPWSLAYKFQRKHLGSKAAAEVRQAASGQEKLQLAKERIAKAFAMLPEDLRRNWWSREKL